MQHDTIEIFLPVYNEEGDLLRNVPQLLGHIETMAQEISLHIVDNASTDDTQRVSLALAKQHPRLRYTRLEQKGRGYALTQAWLASTATIVGYMDIDLSTDLIHLDALLQPLLQQEADLVVGSRLSKASRVENRSLKREILSRGYNQLLRFTLAMPVHDAQCGFKALRQDMFASLAHEIHDTQWFFDSELIFAAGHRGYRVHEVPVHWVDDRASTVHVGKTVLQDLKGMWRVYRLQRPDSLFARLLSFGSIGILTTVGYFMMYAYLSSRLPAQVSNILALSVMTLLNTALNRYFTFHKVGRLNRARHYMVGIGAFLLSWSVSAGGILLLLQINPAVHHLQESLWVTLFSLLATIIKYAVFAFGFREHTAPRTAIAAPIEKKELELV